MRESEEREKEFIKFKAVAEVERARAAELAQAYKELKDTQEKLIDTEKLAILGKLAGTIAHELRTPLGSIQNVTYFLRKKLGPITLDDKITKHLKILQDGVNVSDTIINDVLTFSRDRRPFLTRVDSNVLLRGAIGKISVPENIDVVMNLKSDVPDVVVDAEQIIHVLLNVLLNAVQAMPAGGRLTIKNSVANDFVNIEITDAGAGISQENFEEVFEPLFSTKIRGTGLGLPISKKLVAANKGDIHMESEPGKGTKVTIALPVA